MDQTERNTLFRTGEEKALVKSGLDSSPPTPLGAVSPGEKLEGFGLAEIIAKV